MHEYVEVKLVSQAVPARLAAVQRLSGDEEIGRPFSFDVTLVTVAGEVLEQAALLEHPVTIEFLRDAVVERLVHGVVWSVRSSLTEDAGHLVYRLEIGPRFRALALSSGSEVFLDKSVVEIIGIKLERAGLFAGADYDLRLMASYPQRDLVMQYAESDLAFVTRLCEHWGISITFEHVGGRDVAVFSDDNARFSPIRGLDDGEALLTYRRRNATRGLYDLDAVTRTLPAAYVVDDYNYRTPAVALRTAGPIAAGSAGVMSEFGPHAKTPGEAQLFATVRAQEIAATRHVLEGKSDDPRLRAGSRITIDGHPTEDGEIVVVAVHHEIEQSVFGRDAGARQLYRAEFRAIPASTPFRPTRLTPKPRVHGVIPAIIESASGEQYADPDGDGRYHVRFKLDAGSAPKGQASKLVRMAQPHVGAGYGFHMPLRSGVEVMVACLDGDPDRPLISGAVPNPTTPSVVNAGNAMRNVLRFGGRSEINVDDKEGSTRIKLTTPFGDTTFQMGAQESPAEGFYFGTQKDFVGKMGGLIRMTADKSVTVDAGTTMSFSAQDSISSKAGTSMKNQAGTSISTNAGTSIASEAGTSMTSTAGTTFTATAGDSVSITASGSTMTLDAASKLSSHAPAIEVNAGATLAENAPMITVKAGAELAQSAPIVMTKGDAVVMVQSGAVATVTSGALLALASGALLTATSATIMVDGTTITISGSGQVTISGPAVTVNASVTATVSAPTVNVTGATTTTVSGSTTNINGGTVNVKGGQIKLNC